MTHIDADVSARDESAEPRDVRPGDAWTDYPETGVLHQIIACVAMNTGLDNNLLAVLGDSDALDLADLHRFVADLGLVRLQIVGGVECDLDGDALGQLLVHGHERTGNDHDGGEDPHKGQAQSVPSIRQRLGQLVDGRRWTRLSHASPHPTAAARRRTARPAW